MRGCWCSGIWGGLYARLRQSRKVFMFTVNGGFGAGAVAAGTGILLNNEMDDFAVAPGVPNLFGLVGGDANAIASRKTP